MPLKRDAMPAFSMRGLPRGKYMLGDTYTIVDMNVWGWARLIPTVLGDGALGETSELKTVGR
jgi:glutathione S-transferase